MKFRKWPAVIEAIQCSVALQAAAHAWNALPLWLRDAYDTGDIVFFTDYLSIKTLGGMMRADQGDWIIRGVKGEIYPCKPDIFAATYEPVDE